MKPLTCYRVRTKLVDVDFDVKIACGNCGMSNLLLAHIRQMSLMKQPNLPLSLPKLRVNSLLCKFETCKIKFMVASSRKLYMFAVENNFWLGALLLVDVK
jgi:hypothetical protein